jgi:hypothetical protein
LCHLFDNTEYLGKVLLVILEFSETGHLTVTQVRVLIQAELLPKADKRGLGYGYDSQRKARTSRARAAPDNCCSTATLISAIAKTLSIN